MGLLGAQVTIRTRTHRSFGLWSRCGHPCTTSASFSTAMAALALSSACGDAMAMSRSIMCIWCPIRKMNTIVQPRGGHTHQLDPVEDHGCRSFLIWSARSRTSAQAHRLPSSPPRQPVFDARGVDGRGAALRQGVDVPAHDLSRSHAPAPPISRGPSARFTGGRRGALDLPKTRAIQQRHRRVDEDAEDQVEVRIQPDAGHPLASRTARVLAIAAARFSAPLPRLSPRRRR